MLTARLTPRVWVGELLRWYLKRARHPFKAYVTGHYWSWFTRLRPWIRYDNTAVINVSLDDYLQQQIFFDGYYERALVEWLKCTLRSDDVFWDVGANIGAVTLVAAPLCRQVVAFEPDPRSLEQLRGNVASNQLTNVEIVAVALGDRDGTALLHQGPSSNTGMSSLVVAREESAQMPVTVIRADSFVKQHGHLSPTVIKLDVEGGEHLVLQGAGRLLSTDAIRAVVFEDRRTANTQPTNAALVQCLRNGGYSIGPLGLSDATADDGMFNFLALPARAE